MGPRGVFLLGVFSDSLKEESSRDFKDTGGRRNEGQYRGF